MQRNCMMRFRSVRQRSSTDIRLTLTIVDGNKKRTAILQQYRSLNPTNVPNIYQLEISDYTVFLCASEITISRLIKQLDAYNSLGLTSVALNGGNTYMNIADAKTIAEYNFQPDIY